VPTKVIVPAGDFLVPPRWQHELAEAIPDVSMVEVPDAGHELVWTHADLVADEIRDFLS
jgi:pimeloyl-ACP methyl ester carboxylesterase